MKINFNKCKYIALVCLGIILMTALVGCVPTKQPSESGDSNTVSSSTTDNVSSQSATSADTTADVTIQDNSNMVDERFELLSLVFRLAGHEEYSDVNTEYQQLLVAKFDGFSKHDAVQYAAKLPLGYDAVFNFSVHISKKGEQFVFIDDIGSLLEDGRWTQQSATDFLELLNGFYVETGFAEFYQSNTDLYRSATQSFVDAIYSQIDLEWFATYVEPGNLRCIYSPSSSRHNYGATVNGTIVYCAVSGDGSVIVHEFCHSFANPISRKWYEENAEFKKWCDDTVDPQKLPNYGNGQTIAGEYVTRAYNILYYVEHGYAPIPLFLTEKSQGFPYIEEVYGMITPYEKPKPGDDKIESLLGVKYEMGEQQLFSAGNREIRWKVLSLQEPLPFTFQQTEVGNIFGSNTGDVLYVEDTGESTPFLLIDLGEATFQGEDGYRMYSRILVE